MIPLSATSRSSKLRKWQKLTRKKLDNQVCGENLCQLPYANPYMIPTNTQNKYSFSKFTNKSTCPPNTNFQRSAGSNFIPLISIPFEDELSEDLTSEETPSNKQPEISSNIESSVPLIGDEKSLLEDKQNKFASLNFPKELSEVDVCNLGLNEDILKGYDEDSYEHLSSDSSSTDLVSPGIVQLGICNLGLNTEALKSFYEDNYEHLSSNSSSDFPSPRIVRRQIPTAKSTSLDASKDRLGKTSEGNSKGKNAKMKKLTKKRRKLDLKKQNQSKLEEIIEVLSIGQETSYENNNEQVKTRLHLKKPKFNKAMNQKVPDSVRSIANKTSKIAENSIVNTENAKNEHSCIGDTITAEIKDISPSRNKPVKDTKLSKDMSSSAKQKHNVRKPGKLISPKNSASIREEDKNQRTFTDLPVANKSSEIVENSIDITKNSKNEPICIGHSKISPSRNEPINKTKHSKDLSSPSKQKHNVPKSENIISLKNSVKSRVANSSQQENSASTKPEGKNQRTFTNLPVRKVQKALSKKAIKQKTLVPKNLNPKLNLNCKALVPKSKPKTDKKHTKLVNTKTNLNKTDTNNQSTIKKMSEVVEVTNLSKTGTGNKTNRKMSEKVGVKVSTTQSKNNKKIVNTKTNINTTDTNNQSTNKKMSKVVEVTDLSKTGIKSKANNKAIGKTVGAKVTTTQSKKKISSGNNILISPQIQKTKKGIQVLKKEIKDSETSVQK